MRSIRDGVGKKVAGMSQESIPVDCHGELRGEWGQGATEQCAKARLEVAAKANMTRKEGLTLKLEVGAISELQAQQGLSQARREGGSQTRSYMAKQTC